MFDAWSRLGQQLAFQASCHSNRPWQGKANAYLCGHLAYLMEQTTGTPQILKMKSWRSGYESSCVENLWVTDRQCFLLTIYPNTVIWWHWQRLQWPWRVTFRFIIVPANCTLGTNDVGLRERQLCNMCHLSTYLYLIKQAAHGEPLEPQHATKEDACKTNSC